MISVNEQLIASLKKPQDSDLKVIEKHNRVKSTSSRSRRHRENSVNKPTVKSPSPSPSVEPVLARQADFPGKIVKNKQTDTSQQVDSGLDSYKTKIIELESEIDDLNKRYKRAIMKSSSEDVDFSELRKELNSLANAIESRCQELYALKTRYGCNTRDISF